MKLCAIVMYKFLYIYRKGRKEDFDLFFQFPQSLLPLVF